MLSRLDKAEKTPDKGWQTLTRQEDENVQEDEVLLLDTADESTKCSLRNLRSPSEYKCQSFKIPLKRTSPRSTSTSNNVSPTTKPCSSTNSHHDNIQALGFGSSFTSKLRSSNDSSLSLQRNSKTGKIRYMMERQRRLPRKERTFHRQKPPEQLSTESSRTKKHEHPFDTEIDKLISNHNENNSDNVKDKYDSSDVDSSADESTGKPYEDTKDMIDTDDVNSQEEYIKQSKRHTFPFSNVTPRPSLHEKGSNKTSFYSATKTITTYQITKNKSLGPKRLTRLYSDDKKRKLPCDDEDKDSSSEEPSAKKSTAQKNNTRKKRGRKSNQQSPEVSLVEIISSDEEDKTEINKEMSDHSPTASTSHIATTSNKSDKDDAIDESSGGKTNTVTVDAIKDNPFERDSFTTEISLGQRVLLGSLQGIAKGPLEITVNQLKWKMEYKEKTTTILVCPQEFTSMKIHIDKDPKIIVLGVAQCLALKLRGKFPGNGKFLDPGSLVTSEGNIVLEVDDTLGPEMVIDLAEWAKETHGKQFDELSLMQAQTIMDRLNSQSGAKSRHYNTRSSSSKPSSVTARKLIIYPPPPLQGAITVTSADLECLAEGEFLNDVIIDFYLKFIYHGILNDKDKERTHIFSSFFYKRLTQRMSNDTEDAQSSQHRLHNKVKKWTRNVDIFSKDFIIVPINESSHWFLAIICYPYLDDPVLEEEISDDSLVDVETEEESDSEDFVETSKKDTSNKLPVLKAIPCILIFDSLGGSGRARVTANLRSYLSCEWKEKRQDQPSKEFSKETIKGTFPKVPKQDNFCDCGIFLLQYVQSFFQDPIKNFRPPINKVDWFTQTKVASKRQEIKDLILCLSETPDEAPSDE